MAFNFNTMIGGGGTANLKNYIAGGTVITVKADGTGDFTSLKDAVDSLTGKFSDGKITISIGAGTFNITETVVIDGGNFNFAELEISGAGKENTIIQNTSATQYQQIILVQNTSTLVVIKNLTTKGASSSSGVGIASLVSCNINIIDVEVDNCFWGLYPDHNSRMFITDVKGTDLNYVMNVNRGSKVFCRGNFTISNAAQVFHVSNASTINVIGVTTTFTNVTTTVSQTINTITSNGMIVGNV